MNMIYSQLRMLELFKVPQRDRIEIHFAIGSRHETLVIYRCRSLSKTRETYAKPDFHHYNHTNNILISFSNART